MCHTKWSTKTRVQMQGAMKGTNVEGTLEGGNQGFFFFFSRKLKWVLVQNLHTKNNLHK